MRLRLGSLFVLLAFAAALHAQPCVPGGGVLCTPNLNLWLPPANYPNWNIPNNANFGIIDTQSLNWAKLNGNNTFTGPLIGASLNSAINPLICGITGPPSWCAGSDLGAWVNAAAATCTLGPCNIVIPSQTGQLSFTTPITMISGETVQCSRSGGITGGTGSQYPAQLSYTGSSTAITMNNFGSYLIGCSMQLSGNAAAGVLVGGTSNYIDQTTIYGGGNNTVLVHFSGTNTEDNHLQNSRLYNFTGVGVQIDHANDTYLTADTAYAVANNGTSVTILIDSMGAGTAITDFAGGNSGLHGLWVRNTLSGGGPSWIFAKNFESDCSTGAGWLFDSTLGSGILGATFLNSWAAGAGSSNANCDQTVIPGVPGIQISGGSNIHIGGGSKIRSNSGDGILVNGQVVGLQIENNLITGNGFCPPGQTCTPTYSGVNITANAYSIQINNNSLGNTGNLGENQNYGVNLTAGASVLSLQVMDNLCDLNKAACLNSTVYSNGVNPGHVMVFGNTTSSDTISPRAQVAGDLAVYSGNQAPLIAPHMVPLYGGPTNDRFGFGGNLWFDGSNWRTNTDTTNDGAFGLIGNYGTGAPSCLLSIPPSSSGQGQTLTPTQLATYCVVSINGTNVSVPALGVGGATNTVYRCTTAGTLPVGALTTVSSDCGATAATGLTVN